MGSLLNGFLVVDKPEGMTSHDIVAAVRRRFKIRKVGHLGTLDPLATGVLPLAMGKATRLAQFLSGGIKVYEGIIQLGFSTSTYDREGEATSEQVTPVYNSVQLAQVSRTFQGELSQVPPPFSAKKVQGIRSYSLARKGVKVELPPRVISVYSLELQELLRNQLGFKVQCSAGTYVRGIAHEIGKNLGCGAHLFSLRRTASGEFDLGHAITAASLSLLSWSELLHHVIPLNQVMLDFPAVTAQGEDMKKLAQGQVFSALKPRCNTSFKSLFRVLSSSAELMGLARAVDERDSSASEGETVGRFQPKVVLI